MSLFLSSRTQNVYLKLSHVLHTTEKRVISGLQAGQKAYNKDEINNIGWLYVRCNPAEVLTKLGSSNANLNDAYGATRS